MEGTMKVVMVVMTANNVQPLFYAVILILVVVVVIAILVAVLVVVLMGLVVVVILVVMVQSLVIMVELVTGGLDGEGESGDDGMGSDDDYGG